MHIKSIENLYPLDQEDQSLVLLHLRTCGDCEIEDFVLKDLSAPIIIVKGDTLCFEIQALLEEGQRYPERGFELVFDHHEDAERYRWLLNTPLDLLPTRSTATNWLLLPQKHFLEHALVRYMEAGPNPNRDKEETAKEVE